MSQHFACIQVNCSKFEYCENVRLNRWTPSPLIRKTKTPYAPYCKCKFSWLRCHSANRTFQVAILWNFFVTVFMQPLALAYGIPRCLVSGIFFYRHWLEVISTANKQYALFSHFNQFCNAITCIGWVPLFHEAQSCFVHWSPRWKWWPELAVKCRGNATLRCPSQYQP